MIGVVYFFYQIVGINAVFNYEISSRVHDTLLHFTFVFSRVLDERLNMIQSGIVNISDCKAPLRPLFYPAQVTYQSQIANIYSAFENNFTYGYGVYPALPNGLYCYWNCQPEDANVFSIYSVNGNGEPLNFSYAFAYNATITTRPWYKLAKRLRSKCWTPPYIDDASGQPVITLVYPIVNTVFRGEYMTFAGALGVDIYLEYISTFLTQAFRNTDKYVFIVDQYSMHLIGNSLNASTSVPSTVNPGALVIRRVVRVVISVCIRHDYMIESKNAQYAMI